MADALYWFRRDLRLRDQPNFTLARAGARKVYAVACEADLTELNERQRAFWLGGLSALRADLAGRGATLSYLRGDAAQALAAAAARLKARTIVTGRAYDAAGSARLAGIADALRGQGLRLRAERGDAVFEPEDIAAVKHAGPDGYVVFAPFYEAWRERAIPQPGADPAPDGTDPECGEIPAVPPLAGAPQPGEAHAETALASFLRERAASYAYDAAYPARDGTSRLDAYLRFGMLGPRRVVLAVQARAFEPWVVAEERVSLDAFLRRMAWRDFFMHLSSFAPHTHDVALQVKMRGFAPGGDPALTAAWREGRTGYPLVDAALRQLRACGWLHPRAATVAASFLCVDLGADWRAGRDHWMAQLLSADASLADGNWQMLAGIGADPVGYPRIYNPTRQARLYDARGEYVRRWCHELAELPEKAALAPWQTYDAAQAELDLFAADRYPRPIVDHERAAAEFERRYRAFREPDAAAAMVEPAAE